MNEKTINRMILATWILLFSCFIFKIFSNDLFEIMVNNEKFIEIVTEINKKVNQIMPVRASNKNKIIVLVAQYIEDI